MREIEITQDDVYEIWDEVLEAESEQAIRFNYSGRAMYGDTCFGVVTDLSEALLVLKLARVFSGMNNWPGRDQEMIDIAFELAENIKADSMGRSTIYYWPSLKVTVNPED